MKVFSVILLLGATVLATPQREYYPYGSNPYCTPAPDGTPTPPNQVLDATGAERYLFNVVNHVGYHMCLSDRDETSQLQQYPNCRPIAFYGGYEFDQSATVPEDNPNGCEYIVHVGNGWTVRAYRDQPLGAVGPWFEWCATIMNTLVNGCLMVSPWDKQLMLGDMAMETHFHAGKAEFVGDGVKDPKNIFRIELKYTPEEDQSGQAAIEYVYFDPMADRREEVFGEKAQ